MGKIIDNQKTILPEEVSVLNKASDKRKKEYIAGRVICHKLLTELGFSDSPVLRGVNREPIWPNSIKGSITHCDTFAAVAMTQDDKIKSIGIDLETTGILQVNVIDLIATNNEKKWLQNVKNLENIPLDKVIFSAKEATYKCIYSIIKQFIDFQEIEIKLNVENKTFSVDFLSCKLQSINQNLLVGNFSVNESSILTTIYLKKE